MNKIRNVINKNLKLANKLDKLGFFKVSDIVLENLIKIANEAPFQLAEGLDYNDPKTVMDYFMGYAFDMFKKKNNISKKRLEMEVAKKVDEKYDEMSPDDKSKYSNLKDEVLQELTMQFFWNDLPDEEEAEYSSTYLDVNSPGFENALKYMFDVEGGFSEYNPKTGDPRTNLGIIQSEYDEYRNKKGLPQQNVMYIDKEEAIEIYFMNYWTPTNAEQIYTVLPKVALTIFDFAVNSGLGGASYVVSSTLDIPSTRFDDKMINAIIEAGEQIGDENLAESLIQRRFFHYDEIITADPRKAVYRKGWHNRLKKLQRLKFQS